MNQPEFDRMLKEPNAWETYEGFRGNPIAKLFDNHRQHSVRAHVPTSDEILTDIAFSDRLHVDKPN